jgi:oligo-alginate lyase
MSSIENISRRSLMKLLAIVSAVFLGSASLRAEPIANPSEENAAKGRRIGRPRLFYNTTALKHIRQMLSSDPAKGAFLRNHGDELLKADFIPESVAEIGGGQQSNYGAPGRQIADMGLTLGLLYQLTGEKRYANKLRSALLYYATYVRWGGGPALAQRVPPWHSVLETTEFSFGYSSGYDALWEFLTAGDRKVLAETMVHKVVEPILNDWVLPGKRIHSLDSMGHNWWGVCVTGAGLCALALLGDDPRAQAWIDAVDAGFAQWFDYKGNILQNRMPTFEQSGPSYEGVNYTNYGVSQYLHYRLAWQNTFPQRKAPRIEPLDHIATYFLQTLYPTSWGFLTVNFDDAPPSVDVTETLLLLAACGFRSPDIARYLAHVRTHPQGTLLSLLRQSPSPQRVAQGNAPDSSVYGHMGWATMRSSWENDATFLAMKSGYTWNHAHADAGTFVLFKNGKPLIIDSGTCRYSRPEYSTYYRTSRAHNVILFNGQGQAQEDLGLGCKFPGHLHSLIDGHGLKYVYADATGPMARWFTRNYRHWLWSGNLVLIADDVRAHDEGQLDWLLHYAGDYKVDPRGGVRLSNDSATALVRVLYPPSQMHEDSGLADHDPDKKVPYLVFRPQAQARLQQFIAAIDLNPEAAAKYEVIEDPTYVGLRIQTADAAEEFYISRRAIATPGTMVIRIGEWTTDAYLLHLRRASASGTDVDRFFVSDGSYLRHGDQSILESLSKLTVCWSPGDPLEVFSDDASFLIQVAAEGLPGSVRWNGQAIKVEYDGRKNLVRLKRPQHGAT